MRIALVVGLAGLAACGHSHGGGPKDGGGDGGGGSDAQIDAPNVRGVVAVHVANAADPATSNGLVCAPNQHVVFIDTDATQTDVTTDNNGDAQASVFPGASVHVICHRQTTSTPGIAYLVTTIQAIEPGDHLVVNEGAMITGRQTADATAAGTFKVMYSSYSGASAYTVYGSCGGVSSGSTSAMLTMQAGCVQSTMDVVAVALNGSGTPIGYAEQAGVTFASGGSTTIPANAWHAIASVTETVSNPPSFCSNSADPNYPCTYEVDRYVPGLHGLFTSGVPAVAMSSALAQSAKMQTIVSTNSTPQQTLTVNVDGTQTADALDLGPTLLPWLCTAAASCAVGDPACCIAGAPAFDAPNARITMNVSATAPIDIFEADVTYVRANTTIFIWRVFGPTPGDVQLPSLPVADGDVTPRTGDKQSATHAMIGESDAISGWRPARQNVFDSLETCEQPTSATAQRYGGTTNRLSRSN